MIRIQSEQLTAPEYIDFLARTDVTQYNHIDWTEFTVGQN